VGIEIQRFANGQGDRKGCPGISLRDYAIPYNSILRRKKSRNHPPVAGSCGLARFASQKCGVSSC
jgi:hypothetical protein